MTVLPLVLRNLWRSRVRTTLTALAVVLLVVIFSMIGAVLKFLDDAMAERSRDVPAIVTERFRIPSRFDRSWVDQMVHAGPLHDDLTAIKGFHPERHMIWHFAAFTLDPAMQDNNLAFFLIATEPEKIAKMTEGLEGFDRDGRLAAAMKEPPRSRLPNVGILIGHDRLKKINKKVGDVFKVWSITHREGTGVRKPVEMDFEIVGELPGDSRWTTAGFMDYAYLDRVLKETKNELDGKVNLAFFFLDDQPSMEAMGNVLQKEQYRELKAESAATAASRFLESFKSLLWGIKYLLVPAIAVVMTVIVANAIAITVRERTTEIGVLKVLGFSRPQILGLVLGEALLLGVVSGVFGSLLVYVLINKVVGGIPLPIGWFPVFFVPAQALWWGPALGGLTALLGGVLPAWSACRVKVSEVFARVT